LGVADLPFDLSAIQVETSSERATVGLPLADGEKVFGLGLQMEGSDRRGGVFHLREDHYHDGHDRLHAPTPLYISSKGYAVFFNTSRPIDVYVGVGNRLRDPKIPPFRDRNTDPKWDSQPDSSAVEASVQGPGLEVLVFAGPTAMAALQRYNLYCGGGAMPPLWALGFWHRTPSLATGSQALAEVSEFELRQFPLDVLGLEPGWQSRSYPGTMDWSKERFPDPKGFVKASLDKGVHVNLWENPYIAPGSELYKAVDPNFGSHTVWLGAVADLQEKAAADALAKFHTEKLLNVGVSGFKIDEIDGFDNWLWPDHAQFPSGLDGLRMRQIYGLLWQREIEKWFRAQGRRTFGLVRGSNGAASRFPFAIYSDTYDHRQYVTAVTSCSLTGVLWCAEVRDAATPEEWVRRMQSAVLSPITQLNAWSSGTKPWSFPSVEKEIRDAMILREQLAPYLYTAFAQYWLDGVPPVRPMCLVDGGTETDQYMLGDDLLVAPVFVGQTTRTVRLPAGNWYDFATGRRVGNGELITLEPSLATLPIFVREKAAIPMFPPLLHLTHIPKEASYSLRCFGPGPWHCSVFEDDGTSYAYEKGQFGMFQTTVGVDHKVVTKAVGGKWKSLSRSADVVLETEK
jgi:alpha-D-xyloside xylohydrolase